MCCVVCKKEITSPLGDEEDFFDMGRGGISSYPHEAWKTDAGVVCYNCVAVYDAANEHVLEYRMGGGEDFTDEGIKGFLIRDISFARDAVRDSLRKVFFDVLDAYEESSNWRNILRFLSRNLVGRFKSSDFDEKERGALKGLKIGKAVSCIKQGERTVKFFLGVEAAVKKLEEMEKESIEVVDAGTGPLPIFAILAALLSEKTRVTALEMNPASYEYAKRVLERFRLEDRINLVLCDATEYVHGKPIDLLVTETMYSGLVEEPMAQILENMVEQVSKDGIVVPEWVTVEAGIVDGGLMQESPTHILPFAEGPREVEKLTRDNLFSVLNFSIRVPYLAPGKYCVFVGSEIGVCDGVILKRGESDITTPHHVGGKFSVPPNNGVEITVSYVAGSESEGVSVTVNCVE